MGPGIPVSHWRSVGYSQNILFAESFVDELAASGGKDPVEFRRRLLSKSPRLLAALDLAAGKAGWGQPLPAGHGRGVSVSNNIGSNTVQVAEVSVERGKVKVHRVVCAVDCGHVVNPWGVEQQIQSGIVFGLSAAAGSRSVAAAWSRATSITTTCCGSTRCPRWKCTSFPARRRRRNGRGEHAGDRSSGVQRDLRGDGEADSQAASTWSGSGVSYLRTLTFCWPRIYAV